MKTMLGSVREFLLAEDGPTAVEYAVILGLIVLVCISAIASFGTKTKDSFSGSALRLPS